MTRNNIVFVFLVTVTCAVVVVTAFRYLPLSSILSSNNAATNDQELAVVREIDSEVKDITIEQKTVEKVLHAIQSAENKKEEIQVEPVGVIELVSGEQIKKVAIMTAPVVLKLYASWCGACKMADKIMPDIVTEYQGKVNFYALDITNADLVDVALEMGLLKEKPRSIPTFVAIDASRSINDVHVGYMQKDAMSNYIKGIFSL